MESDSLASVSKGVTYFFKLVITINQKNQKKKKNQQSKEPLKFVKILSDPLPQFTFWDNRIRI